MGDVRLGHYLGNVFTVWSDELRLKFLADNLSSSCALRYDFKSEVYFGREEVLNALKLEFLEGTYMYRNIVCNCHCRISLNIKSISLITNSGRIETL